jgi:hypothetical protein
MKRLIIIPVVIVGLLGLIVALQEIGFQSGIGRDQSGRPGLIISDALAAKQELKAGMIDTKTGKKIKYWV